MSTPGGRVGRRAALAVAAVIGAVLIGATATGAAPFGTAPIASAAARAGEPPPRSAPARHLAAPPAGPPGVLARAGELATAAHGDRLWSRRMTARRPMASITKVMTAIVVIRAGDLERPIRITRAEVRYVRRHDASNAGLQPGDVLTARQLLEAMLLPSGCDAAYALATAYGPGRAAFIAKMNATARQLGTTGTRFSNFDGLPWPTPASTYSTPRDLLILGRAAMRLTTFRRIVRQQAHVIGPTARHHGYYWQNTNLLLGSYPGAIGIKTGYTGAAGFCLLFEARRGGRTLIGVVLHSTATQPDARFVAAERLLNWGFARLGIARPGAARPARRGPARSRLLPMAG